MDKIKQLERLAREAHAAGGSGHDFTLQHSETIKAAEPYSLQKYRRLRANLVAIVISGTTDGMFAAGDIDACSWSADDAAEQLTLAGFDPAEATP